jgi:flagellar biosynthesis chaperone FliJ
MSLKKTEVKNSNGQTHYISYSIDDLSSITKWVGGGKALFEEIINEFTNINIQSKALFDKQIEIAAHYQAQIKQIENKVAQTETKLAEAESKLDSCDGQLINKTQALEAIEKELKEKHEDCEKLLSTHDNNNGNDTLNLLEETTNSYESKLNAVKEDLNQKTRQIQLIHEQLKKTEATKNESKQLAVKLVDNLESANKTIIQLKAQIKNQNTKEISNIENDELSDLKQRITVIEQNKQTSNSSSRGNGSFLSRQTSVSTDSSKIRYDNDEKGIEIEMKTSLPSFSGRSDTNQNIGDWLFQTKKIMDLAKYTDAQMVAVGTNHLIDLAAQDYILHEKMYGIHKTWSEFAEFMTKKHTPANHNQTIRSKIKSIVQITSIKDYYNEFRILALQATDMNEAEKLNSFINGMKPDIRKYVNMQLPKTLDNAYDKAHLYETFNHERHESAYVSNQSSLTNQDKQHNNHTNNSNSNNIINNHIDRTNSTHSTYKQNPYRNDTCSTCNRRGHLATRCFENKTLATTSMALADEELPRWTAQINGINVQVILDSGAIRSFISKSLADKLNLKVAQNGRHIETATGEIANVSSTQPVEIIFESIPAIIEFNITNIASIQVALGKDWFKQTGVLVDPRNDAFILPQRLVNTDTN